MREAGGTVLAGTGLESDSVLLIVAAVGPAVRKARLRQRRSQTAVAVASGLVESILSRIESGQRIPRLDQLVALCDTLGVRPSDVLRFAEDGAFPLGGDPWTDQPDTLLGGPEPDRFLLKRKRAVMPGANLV